jgi:peptidoglycan/xylan/chitin deacetylase (PgdA/CDA1 family)
MKAILTYHSIDRTGSVISLSPEQFGRHVEWMAASGIAVVPLGGLPDVPADSDAIALTFDDGFSNFASEAWPRLESHGFRATLFVATAHAGRVNGWESGQHRVPVLPLLGWEALGRLAESGVELGSHSVTHPDMRRIPASQLEEEVGGSAERIRAETGRVAEAFAYPYGAHDERAVEKVRAVYARAVTTEFRELSGRDDAARLPRLDACYFGEPGRLERWGTASFRRFITIRRRLRGARSFFTRG